ncbi:MAG: YebO family protein, partial [Muribaculaceae bacterium]|nr:YebO family protein [Muribaculaceae bacterium]
MILDNAERIAIENPDSALYMLDAIDPIELAVDSLKAKYHLINASIHDSQGHLMLADSLIRFSAEYYKDKDPYRAISSATLAALYDYWVRGDINGIYQLDSLANLVNLPDSVAVIPLGKRAYWSNKLYDVAGNRTAIKRLITLDKDSASQSLYKYWLYLDYLFDNQNDSALFMLNDLIRQAVNSKSSEDQFRYEYEKIGALEESGRYSESLGLADKFLEKAPGNSIEHYIHLWKSLATFNMGNRDQAVQELEKADSCALTISEAERGYYNSFAYVLHTVFEFQKTGKLKLISIALINNRQKDNLLRTQSLQKESEKNSLMIENKRLSLKVKSERQMSVIIIVILVGLLISGLSIWFALNRRRKAIEAEERAEVLQKMVEELKAPSSSSGQDSLRRAMMQQLGIIKMVAETPTEQNRDMLRKLSSIESDTEGVLVNWANVYEIIDNLYSGFYTRLHDS